ncbi:MAG: ATP-binding protein [Sedimenticola sp.]|nr:ATP-binding protein [Sedimenticola sp.]
MMDDHSFDQLKDALKITPQNSALLALVVKTHLDRKESEDAIEVLDAHGSDVDTDDGLAVLAARAYMMVGDAETALKYLESTAPEVQLLKAKALLALEQRSEGYKVYRQAVEENPTLEDTELEASLKAKVVEFASNKSGAKLKVISNDDTDVLDLDRLIAPPQEKINFKAIGGLDNVKRIIHKKIILPYQKPGLFQRFKKRAGGGVLMYGPPGCGKTLLARATAGECNAQFFNVSISDVLDMYIGESERKLHALFEQARESTPAVLFFDEVEALGGKRQSTRDAASSKLVSQFLSEMDGFAQDNNNVLILAATNVPWSVDAAFRRPGRFDRVLFVPPPDQQARQAILDSLLAERPVEEHIDTSILARKTSGFSGADIRELVETASDEAIEMSIESGIEKNISMDHLMNALDDVRPTTLEWLTTARNYARYANEGGQYNDVLDFLREHGKC